MKHVIVMVDGIEVMGRATYISADTLQLEHPVMILDLFRVNPRPEFIWYTKDNKIMFNRNAIAYEYEPVDIVSEMYETFINDPDYTELAKHADETMRAQIDSFKNRDRSLDPEPTRQEVAGAISDILSRMSKDKRKMN